jgi:hypothetical protein
MPTNPDGVSPDIPPSRIARVCFASCHSMCRLASGSFIQYGSKRVAKKARFGVRFFPGDSESPWCCLTRLQPTVTPQPARPADSRHSRSVLTNDSGQRGYAVIGAGGEVAAEGAVLIVGVVRSAARTKRVPRSRPTPSLPRRKSLPPYLAWSRRTLERGSGAGAAIGTSWPSLHMACSTTARLRGSATRSFS